MAEPQKKDPYLLLVNAIATSGLTDDDLRKHLPKTMNWWEKGSSEETRRKNLEKMMGNPDFQKELRVWDDFSDYDFSGYVKPEDDSNTPGNLANADIKDVEKWYDRAKLVLDPKGLLGKTELYDTSGDLTFQQLEDKIGPDYEGDWFGNLLNEFGYNDDADGYEQLTQDLQAALTRMKNHDFQDKFGSAKTPLKFLFQKTFDALDDGQKPKISDTLIDAGTNIAWTVPAAKMFPLASGIVRSVPKAGKAAELVMKGNAPKTLLGKVGKSLSTAAAVPTGTEIADYLAGTDTENEKREGIVGRAVTAGTGALVNLATPGLAKMVPLRGGSMLANFNLSPKDAAYVNRKLADFVDFGSKQDAAKAKLQLLQDAKDDAAEVVANLTKNLGKRKGPVSTDRLSEAVAWLPDRMQEDGAVLAKMIEGNSGSLKKGAKAFINSFEDPLGERILKNVAMKEETLMDVVSPYLSSYVINRLGTNGVAKFVKKMFSRYTNRFSDEE